MHEEESQDMLRYAVFEDAANQCEVLLQEMSKDDKAAFDLSKRMWKEGHVAPLVVKHDSREG